MSRKQGSIDLRYVKDQLYRLISIDSRNPTLSPGAPGEKALAEYLHAELQRLHVDVAFQATADPERPNVVAHMPGRDARAPALMLNGHMDTVNVEGMAHPFAPWERNGRIYGRGSQDMKGSLAVMLGVAERLVAAEAQPPGDLWLAFVADEEGNSIGTEALIQEHRCSRALVLEPTELHAAVAHRGFAWYAVRSQGRAAHGSRFQDGIDAIAQMGALLQGVQALARELVRRPPAPWVGPPSLHASTIQGGTELSVYPAQCLLTLERRTTSEADAQAAAREIQSLVNAANRALGEDRLTWETLQTRAPFQARTDSALLDCLEAACRRVTGAALARTGAPYWTDAALLAAAGMDCILFGPTGFGLHTAEEWIELDSLRQLGEILLQAIRHPA